MGLERERQIEALVAGNVTQWMLKMLRSWSLTCAHFWEISLCAPQLSMQGPQAEEQRSRPTVLTRSRNVFYYQHLMTIFFSHLPLQGIERMHLAFATANLRYCAFLDGERKDLVEQNCGGSLGADSDKWLLVYLIEVSSCYSEACEDIRFLRFNW
jgi:hypothetical protein